MCGSHSVKVCFGLFGMDWLLFNFRRGEYSGCVRGKYVLVISSFVLNLVGPKYCKDDDHQGLFPGKVSNGQLMQQQFFGKGCKLAPVI